jgi:hypothetical protein
MSTRFASFEAYKGWLTDKETGQASVGSIFIGKSLDFCLSASIPESLFSSMEQPAWVQEQQRRWWW